MARHASHRGRAPIRSPKSSSSGERRAPRDLLGRCARPRWQQREAPAGSAQIKKGLARALTKATPINSPSTSATGRCRIRDIRRSSSMPSPRTHPRRRRERARRRPPSPRPDTWEGALSSARTGVGPFERLIEARKLRRLALLRNLRLMQSAACRGKRSPRRSRRCGRTASFPTASSRRRATPRLRPELESAMLKSLDGPCEACVGATAGDGRGDGHGPLGAVGDDASRAALRAAILARESCESVEILHLLQRRGKLPPRRGLRRDAIVEPGAWRHRCGKAVAGDRRRGYLPSSTRYRRAEQGAPCAWLRRWPSPERKAAPRRAAHHVVERGRSRRSRKLTRKDCKPAGRLETRHLDWRREGHVHRPRHGRPEAVRRRAGA